MSYKSAPVHPVDIITYRHKEKLVYVKPADSYEVALDLAQKEFEELSYQARDRISFSVMSTYGKGERCPIRISESAWPSAVSRLQRGEIIDVDMRSGSATPPKSEMELPPPQYLEVPKTTYPEPSKPSSKKIAGSTSAPSSRGSSPNLENRRSWFGSITR
ncbi:hypothetical protein FA13DRAFT_1726164 [Coprinellus micaceus]|uniref:Uncharacterized protein n=1 Tax=Coprinellus micaceus TaxID=71717 RepID=A0A4Y7TWF7_COPMI|nr:hypothetical protein FA13DRAFT_1726164 [Coprinellus micaceus]